jgi:hypothetical protein
MCENKSNIDIDKACELVNGLNGDNIKYIKKEKGLLEKSQCDGPKIIMEEDNRELIYG